MMDARATKACLFLLVAVGVAVGVVDAAKRSNVVIKGTTAKPGFNPRARNHGEVHYLVFRLISFCRILLICGSFLVRTNAVVSTTHELLRNFVLSCINIRWMLFRFEGLCLQS